MMLTLVDRFLTFLEEDQEYSANTAAAYRNDLSQFTRFVSGAGANADAASHVARQSEPTTPAQAQKWAQVDPALVGEYVAWLTLQGYAAATVARKVAALNSFFHWAQGQGALRSNPAAGVETPKVKRVARQAIEDADMARLISEAGHDASPAGLRDRALIETLYATGMRVSEVVGLNLDDLSPDASALRCGGKQSRTVPLPAGAQEALRVWVAEGRAHLPAAPNEPALFLNQRGRRLTRQGLWLIIKRSVKQVGIKATVTPHSLRHAFAAHQLRAGVDPAHVSHLLGHAGTQSAQAYKRASASGPAEPRLIIDGKPFTPAG